ncbi:MAG: redox-sensing transcriptional repressor Rex [Acidimicrobiia bacterium]
MAHGARRPARKIPEATVARLPLYLRSLVGIADDGDPTISSERLAELSGFNAAQVRKDLSYLGSYGTRGVGYDVEYLLFQMSRELGLTHDWPVVIVGVGNLGHALANYGGFHERGFPVAALVDADPRVVGTVINDITVRHIDELPDIAAGQEIAIGIIATPASAAQEVADRLVAAGVGSILNFAPTILSVPDHVSLRKVDLAVELQILSFYQQRKGGGTLPPRGAPVTPPEPVMPPEPVAPPGSPEPVAPPGSPEPSESPTSPEPHGSHATPGRAEAAPGGGSRSAPPRPPG